MKKGIGIYILVLLMAASVVGVNGELVSYQLEDLVGLSDQIVIASYSGEKKEELRLTKTDGNVTYTIWTLDTQVHIKGDFKKSFKVEARGSSYFYSHPSYEQLLTLQKEGTFLLFLKEYENDNYGLLGSTGAVEIVAKKDGEILGEYTLAKSTGKETGQEINEVLKGFDIKRVNSITVLEMLVVLGFAILILVCVGVVLFVRKSSKKSSPIKLQKQSEKRD